MSSRIDLSKSFFCENKQKLFFIWKIREFVKNSAYYYG